MFTHGSGAHQFRGLPDPTVHPHVVSLLVTRKDFLSSRCKKDVVLSQHIKNLFSLHDKQKDPVDVHDLARISVCCQ